MKNKFQQWSVLPHDPSLIQLEDNLWTIEGTIKTVPMPRRMVIVRLQDNSLLLHNAIALNDQLMSEIESLGRIAWMIVPSGYHRIDAMRYKTRYPDIKVISPKGAFKRVKQCVPVDLDYEEADKQFSEDASVRLSHLAGINQCEGVLQVLSGNRQTLVMNDAVFNLNHLPGLFGLIYGRLLGHAGSLQIPRAFRWVLLKNRKAFSDNLLQLSREPGLERLIPGHGTILHEDIPGTLTFLAHSISPD